MASKKAVLVLAVCAGFVAALGAGVNFSSFAPTGLGIIENPRGDGMAKVKFIENQFETKFSIHITDFLPNTTYGVVLDGDGSGFADGLAITTNGAGNGNYNRTIPGDARPNASVTVFRWDGDIDELFTVSSLEVRAIGVVEVN